MTNLLNQVARHKAEQRHTWFRPASTADYLALRLAHKLDDASAARHYAELIDRHGEERLLTAFHRVTSLPRPERARSFHAELQRKAGNRSANRQHKRLAAIRV